MLYAAHGPYYTMTAWSYCVTLGVCVVLSHRHTHTPAMYYRLVTLSTTTATGTLTLGTPFTNVSRPGTDPSNRPPLPEARSTTTDCTSPLDLDAPDVQMPLLWGSDPGVLQQLLHQFKTSRTNNPFSPNTPSQTNRQFVENIISFPGAALTSEGSPPVFKFNQEHGQMMREALSMMKDYMTILAQI